MLQIVIDRLYCDDNNVNNVNNDSEDSSSHNSNNNSSILSQLRWQNVFRDDLNEKSKKKRVKTALSEKRDFLKSFLFFSFATNDDDELLKCSNLASASS